MGGVFLSVCTLLHCRVLRCLYLNYKQRSILFLLTTHIGSNIKHKDFRMHFSAFTFQLLAYTQTSHTNTQCYQQSNCWLVVFRGSKQRGEVAVTWKSSLYPNIQFACSIFCKPANKESPPVSAEHTNSYGKNKHRIITDHVVIQMSNALHSLVSRGFLSSCACR